MNTNSEKYKLIYGFNKNSPLFARVANDYLLNNDFENAIRILEEGLKSFPDYPSAYLIYSVCLAQLGKITKAKEMAEKGCEFIDLNETLNFYLDKIDGIAKAKNINADENLSDVGDEQLQKSNEEDDDLEALAKKLENAKINIETDTAAEYDAEIETDDSDISQIGKPLVSETLASIYFNQGNFKEALALYQNLITIQPEREQFYLTKINQIKKVLEEN